MIIGKPLTASGGGGECASIFAYGDDLTSSCSCSATKGSKTINGVWTERQPVIHDLPSAYQELYAVESTGTQYITIDGVNYWAESGKYIAFKIGSSHTVYPCYRKSDGEVGGYDTVTEAFFSNQGTGTFRMGAVLDETFMSGYEQVEYIGSSGTQWIDTGANIPYEDLGFVFDMEWLESPSSTCKEMFGVRDTQNASTFIALQSYTGDTHTQNGYNLMSWNTWGQAKATGSHLTGQTVNTRGTVSYNGSTGVLVKPDGTSVTKTTRDASSVSVLSPYIFAVNENNSTFNSNAVANVYCGQVRNGSSAERIMIPCIRRSDSTAGMYDMVNGVFYDNDGTGTFTTGEAVENGYSEGFVVADIAEYGTWTLTATGMTSESVLIDSAEEYQVEMEAA